MTTIELINELRGFSEFISINILRCPNVPKEWKLTGIDKLKSNFGRGTKRTMYYAEHFIINIDKVKNDILSKSENEIKDDYVIVISDNVYFDFDAFVFSCKSLLEENTVRLAKELHPQIRTVFFSCASQTNKNFIQNFLKPIRDEIVHVNNYGSSVGSNAHIKDGKVSIKAFMNNNDLETIFYAMLVSMYNIIKTVGSYLLLHDYLTFGIPEKEVIYNSHNHDYKISDYLDLTKMQIKSF